jgi:hypothetical protein
VYQKLQRRISIVFAVKLLQQICSSCMALKSSDSDACGIPPELKARIHAVVALALPGKRGLWSHLCKWSASNGMSGFSQLASA